MKQKDVFFKKLLLWDRVLPCCSDWFEFLGSKHPPASASWVVVTVGTLFHAWLTDCFSCLECDFLPNRIEKKDRSTFEQWKIFFPCGNRKWGMKPRGDRMKTGEIKEHEEDVYRPGREGAETGGALGFSGQQNLFCLMLQGQKHVIMHVSKAIKSSTQKYNARTGGVAEGVPSMTDTLRERDGKISRLSVQFFCNPKTLPISHLSWKKQILTMQNFHLD